MQNTKKYEFMFIVPGNDHNESTAREVVKNIKSEIEGMGAKIIFDEFWGSRKLAYKIKHNTEGFYQLFNMEFDGSKIAKFEISLNINKNIIRFLIMKIEDNYTPFKIEELKVAETERYEERMAKKRVPKKFEKRRDDKREPKKDELDKKVDKIVKS